METLYIVMPAYNEEINIKKTLDAWYPVIERHNESGKSRLVVINDGSKDDTYKVMQEYAETHPLFVPLSKANGGHGSTVIYAYNYAIKQGADWIFQTDSDGQTNPDEFDDFWNERASYDAILGHRQIRGDGPQRAFVEKVVCFLLRLYFGVKVPDANAPFRLMRMETVNKYLDKMPEDYNLPNIMLTTYFSYYKENITFKNVSFQPRQGGVNSIDLPKIVKIGWKAVGDFKRFKKGMRIDRKYE